MVTQEGSRPLLVEVQALVDAAHVPNPRRLSVGLEQQRLAMLLAVLHRHAGVATFDQDVFVNAVGGVRIQEPAADLAVLLAILSSMRNRPLPRGMVAFGEVGLAGEVRPAPRGQERLREAAKLGFSIAVIPKANAPKQKIEGLEVIAVERLEQALDRLTTAQMRLDDFIDVLAIDIGVPGALRIDHQQRPAGTAIQTAGLVDAHAARAGQARGLDTRLAVVEGRLRAVLRARGFAVAALVEAEEDVVLVVAHRRRL